MKNFSTYFMANLLSKGVAFFSFMYATHYISLDDYGALSYYIAIATLILSITMLGLPGLILTDYINKNTLDRFFLESKILSHIVIVSIILFVCMLVYVFLNSKDIITYGLLLIFIVGNYFTQIETNVLRITNQMVRLSSILILSSLLSLVILLLFIEKYGIIVLLVAMSTPGLLFFLSYIIRRFKKLTQLKYTYPSRSDFNVAIPIMMSSFVMQGYYFIDKYYITTFLGNASLALYEVAFKFGNLYEILIIQVVNTIWMPIFYKKLSESEISTLKYQLKLSFFIYVGGIAVFFIPDIVWKIPTYFIDNKYHESVNYIKFIIFNAIIFQSITFLNMYYIYKKKTKTVMFILFIILCINSIINFFTIEQFQIYGVFIGNIIALSIGFLIFIRVYINELNKNIKGKL